MHEYGDQGLPPGCPSRIGIETLTGNKLTLLLPLPQMTRGQKISASAIVELAPFTNTEVHIKINS